MLHGNLTYLLQDDDGQIIEAHSISAGLDYPGIGPEHAWRQPLLGRGELTGRTAVAFKPRWRGSQAPSIRLAA